MAKKYFNGEKKKLKGKTKDNTLEEEIVDINIKGYQLLPTPDAIVSKYQLTKEGKETVSKGRQSIRNILLGIDERKILVMGPCSIHSEGEAREMIDYIADFSQDVKKEILVVGRTYFEKPRTISGWKGVLMDPHLDGNGDIVEGIELARRLLVYANERGVPCATEFLNPITPQYIGDGISWAGVGARTSEAPLYRELTSGLSMPVGFKNQTNGDIENAINSMIAASQPAQFLSTHPYGYISIVETCGNPYTHLILRGGNNGSNYDEVSIREAQALLDSKGLHRKIMIDCSHGNSNKDHKRQPYVLESVVGQIIEGNEDIIGFMMEVNLKEGKQKNPADLSDEERKVYGLEYGISITDACVGVETMNNGIREILGRLRNRR